ncbi:AAA family ATPase [Magnetovibrio sp. PR-2]|uniref:AAA family ATPase n=1 Tax=Magnetovibrio sp. PR-2 TaxID=3120356 RepID=UPI002FCE175A
MILRINIGAFVLTDAVRDAVDELGADRAFLRSSVNVTEGGMAAALDFLSQRSTPELLIIETTAEDQALFDELNALADVCQPGTRVILIGAENDINLFKTLIDQGISQYFLRTVSGEELIASVIDAFAEKSAADKSRTIAFYGMRGGVGSSEIAHNVALELATKYDEDVILVDLDIPFGTAALSYNIQPAQTVADAVAQAGSIDEPLMMRYLENGGKNVSLLCAPGHFNSGIEISSQALEMVLKVVKQMASYVILDVPHDWNPWIQEVLVDADDTVIIGTPDLYNLRDGKNLFEFLAPNRGLEAPTRLVLNKTGMIKKGELSEKEFTEVLGTKPNLSIPFDGEAFAAAMNNGELLNTVAPKGEATAAVQNLARMVSGKESRTSLEKESKSGGLLSSLFKK